MSVFRQRTTHELYIHQQDSPSEDDGYFSAPFFTFVQYLVCKLILVWCRF